MKKAFILIMVIVITGILAMGCSSKTDNDNEITSVIYKNLAFAENEDIESYMGTIHEQSPKYALTEKQIEQTFNTYDLTHRLDSIKVVEKSDQLAKVKYVQITEKVDGPAFKNFKITGTHILKKSNGKWKLFASEVEKIEYLN